MKNITKLIIFTQIQINIRNELVLLARDVNFQII